VVFIISLVYSLTLNNFKFSSSIKSSSITLEDLPLYLDKYTFSDKLELICLDDAKKCILKIDGNIRENIDGLFSEKPIVYEYNKDLNIIYYDDIELKQLDRYEVSFKYTINKYKKASDIIVEVNNKIYIFNSMYKKALILESSVDVYDYFDNVNKELKDAF